VSPAATGAGRGVNFGWNRMEGTHCYPPDRPMPAIGPGSPARSSITIIPMAARSPAVRLSGLGDSRLEAPTSTRTTVAAGSKLSVLERRRNGSARLAGHCVRVEASPVLGRTRR